MAHSTVPKSMNPLWGLKLGNRLFDHLWTKSSQKHESSLGIETASTVAIVYQSLVPKSMNPLWGLKHFQRRRRAPPRHRFPKA